MALAFDHLGFAPAYQVDLPPIHQPARASAMAEVHFNDRRGADLLVQVFPEEAPSWVGFFGTERRGLCVGVFAGPGPKQLLVATGAEAFLISVDDPRSGLVLPPQPVTAVRRLGADLLGVASFTDLAAVDASGLLWWTARLMLDDLEFSEGPSYAVQVTGTLPGGIAANDAEGNRAFLEVDRSTGNVLTPGWDPWSVPGQDRERWHRDMTASDLRTRDLRAIYRRWSDEPFPTGSSNDRVDELHADLAYWDAMLADVVVPTDERAKPANTVLDIPAGLQSLASEIEVALREVDLRFHAALEGYARYVRILQDVAHTIGGSTVDPS